MKKNGIMPRAFTEDLKYQFFQQRSGHFYKHLIDQKMNLEQITLSSIIPEPLSINLIHSSTSKKKKKKEK